MIKIIIYWKDLYLLQYRRLISELFFFVWLICLSDRQQWNIRTFTVTICCGDIGYRKQAASLVLLQEQTGLLVLAFREFSKISLKNVLKF